MPGHHASGRRFHVGVLVFVALVVARPSPAQTNPMRTVDLMPDDIMWVASPIPGIQAAVLVGNIQQAGLYVLRVRLARDAKLMPHTHPDVRNTTVLKGEMFLGFGETFDPDRMKAYPAGANVTIPANTPHYVWAKNAEVIVQDAGVGPSATAPIQK